MPTTRRNFLFGLLTASVGAALPALPVMAAALPAPATPPAPAPSLSGPRTVQCKAWAIVHVDEVGNATIEEGFNIRSAVDHGEHVVVEFTRALDSEYVVAGSSLGPAEGPLEELARVVVVNQRTSSGFYLDRGQGQVDFAIVVFA